MVIEFYNTEDEPVEVRAKFNCTFCGGNVIVGHGKEYDHVFHSVPMCATFQAMDGDDYLDLIGPEVTGLTRRTVTCSECQRTEAPLARNDIAEPIPWGWSRKGGKPDGAIICERCTAKDMADA